MLSLKWRSLHVRGEQLRVVLAPPVRWLTWALGLVTAAAAAITFFMPGILSGPAVTIANARGTALVALALGVPLLLVAMARARRGSWRWHVAWLGVTAYLAYNAVMFLFATPLNPLFLLYVAMFSLALFTLGSLIHATEPRAVSDQLGTLPARGLAVFTWVIVGMNVLVWLRGIVPTIAAADPTSVLEGTGLTTNPAWIQDLAFWLPMAAVAAAWLWRRRPWGYVLVGAWLVYGLLESIGVATDQLFGHAADPNTPHASVAGAAIFAGLAVSLLVPMFLYFRHRRPPVISERRH